MRTELPSKTCRLFGHRNQQVALAQHVITRNFAGVIFLLFATVAIAAGLVEVAGRQEDVIAFRREELTFEGEAVLNVAQF